MPNRHTERSLYLISYAKKEFQILTCASLRIRFFLSRYKPFKTSVTICMFVCRSVPCKTSAPSRLFPLPSLYLFVDALAFFVFALSRSLSLSRDATRHKLRSQINNAAVLLVPSRPCTRHYRRRSSPVAVYYGPGTLSVAWNDVPSTRILVQNLPVRQLPLIIIIIMRLERWVPSGRIWSGILSFHQLLLITKR